mgnify:CR=1 FL=1
MFQEISISAYYNEGTKFSFHPKNHKLSETLHNKGVHFVKAAREGDQKLCYLWEKINVHNTNITHTSYIQCTYFETNGK